MAATWHGLMHELPSRFIPIGFLNRSRPSFLPRTPQGQQGPTCCVNCVVGSGVPRCPAQGEAKPQQPWGLPQDSE